MAWDLTLSRDAWDLVSGELTGQDEILQRVQVRLLRHLGSWFLNTSAGLPWYDGPSELEDGTLTRDTGIMGSRDFARADLLIRNEIINTDGVIKIIDFNTSYVQETGEYSIRTRIATQYGISGVLSLSQKVTR